MITVQAYSSAASAFRTFFPNIPIAGAQPAPPTPAGAPAGRLAIAPVSRHLIDYMSGLAKAEPANGQYADCWDREVPVLRLRRGEVNVVPVFGEAGQASYKNQTGIFVVEPLGRACLSAAFKASKHSLVKFAKLMNLSGEVPMNSSVHWNTPNQSAAGLLPVKGAMRPKGKPLTGNNAGRSPTNFGCITFCPLYSTTGLILLKYARVHLAGRYLGHDWSGWLRVVNREERRRLGDFLCTA